MNDDVQPSFTRGRRWAVSLNLVLTTGAVIAIVAMLNYLSSRHFLRFDWSGSLTSKYSPLTRQVISALTNDVRITIYFRRTEPLYDSVVDLLKEYRFLNDHISINLVDYETDPGAAVLVKSKYHLESLTDKDLIIFDSSGGRKFVSKLELTDLDTQALISGQSKEIRRTHFRGEMLFTSAILSVTTLRPLKAYVLHGHGEHQPDSTDKESGYSRFMGLLKDNNVNYSRLSLLGTNEVPADCNLLIIAGPTTRLAPIELSRIDQYLQSGGRLMAFFNFYALGLETGLERILANWGVDVGQNRVDDPANTATSKDVMSMTFGDHLITRPLMDKAVDLVLPRSIRKKRNQERNPDSATVTELLFTGPEGTTSSDLRNRIPYFDPTVDVRTNVAMAVAVEKGKIRDVAADRGTTRMVIVGDSYFLTNKLLDSMANQDFLTLSINWLLDRTEMLKSLGPRPIVDYKLEMTHTQVNSVRWLFLVGMPGSVLLVGAVVWFRRRR